MNRDVAYRRRRRLMFAGSGEDIAGQLVQTDLLHVYHATEDSQLWVDQKGGPSIQRGSTAGADTNDPIFEAALKTYRYVLDDLHKSPHNDFVDGLSFVVVCRVRVAQPNGGNFGTLSSWTIGASGIGENGRLRLVLGQLETHGAAAGKFKLAVGNTDLGNRYGVDHDVNEWMHVVGTGPPFTTNGIQLWVNNVLEAQIDGGTSSVVAPHLIFGQNCRDTDIGLVAIYRGRIPPATIAANHPVLKSFYPGIP